MQTLVEIEGLFAYYSARVNAVSTLIEQTAQILIQAEWEQESLAEELKDLLAKARSFRRKDFDWMMEGIRTRRRRREQKVIEMVQGFRREEEAMVEELRAILSGRKAVSSETFRAFGEDIHQRQRAREREVSRLLKDFYLEQEELGAGLKKLLANGNGTRVKDFKALVKGFEASQNYRECHLAQVLKGLERVRQEVEAQWQQIMGKEYKPGGVDRLSSQRSDPKRNLLLEKGGVVNGR